MARYPHSKHSNTSSRKPRSIKRARLTERRRIRRNNQHHDARPKKQINLKSSPMLVARSEELLTSFLEKYGSKTPGHDIFKGLLKAKLGEKFRRMQRKHRQKALAVASAMYHVISRKPDPVAALQLFVKQMNVSPPRGSDPCRTIVECLFYYGSTAEERTQNRQYACADANALRYIIRKGIEPQKVLAPDEGELITKWAKREAKYRRQKTASDTCSKVPEAKRSMTSEWTEGKLPVGVRLNGAIGCYRYGPRRACFWSSPKIMDARWWLPSRNLRVSPSRKPSAAQTRCERPFRRRSTRQFKRRL